MLGWLGYNIPIRCLINQLVVTETLPPVMGSVLSIANGLLSLKQFANGSVLIGGGWQGEGNIHQGGTRVIPENLRGNVRLAQYVVPRLDEAQVLRVWLGLESETPRRRELLERLRFLRASRMRRQEPADAYKRYLVNGLRETFHMPGVPIRIQLRGTKNPYADK